MWLGAGTYFFWLPTIKGIISIRVSDYRRLQLSASVIFFYRGDDGEAYSFSVRWEDLPSTSKKYLWGISGGIILPRQRYVTYYFDWNTRDVYTWGKEFIIWGGVNCGIF